MDETERGSAFAELEFQKAIFNGLSAHIAILDSRGTILGVNTAWQAFGESNGLRDKQFGVGANYLAACRAAVDPDASAAFSGIKEVLSGTRSSFYLEYPCHSPAEQRWFALRATPLAGYSSFVVVAHENITERVTAENSLRERSDRLEAQLMESAVAADLSDTATAEDATTDRKLILLVVDDDAALLEVTTHFFETMNAQVHAAADGPSAIEILESGVKPDCILTDYHMPGMSGIDMILQARERIGDVPSIIMSGDASAEIVGAADLDYCTLIQKPFEFGDLFTLINQTIASSN